MTDPNETLSIDPVRRSLTEEETAKAVGDLAPGVLIHFSIPRDDKMGNGAEKVFVANILKVIHVTHKKEEE